MVSTLFFLHSRTFCNCLVRVDLLTGLENSFSAVPFRLKLLTLVRRQLVAQLLGLLGQFFDDSLFLRRFL